jgi:hypothetical protein
MEKVVIEDEIINYIIAVAKHTLEVKPPLMSVFEKYSAKSMTKEQVELFEEVLKRSNERILD